MLLQFSVKNFLSLRNEQVFTTLANPDKCHAETNLIKYKLKSYSKTCVIYGANASGKSNLFKAIAFVQSYVTASNNLLENSEIPVEPFVFDGNKEPSEFGLLFVKDGTKYAYSFSCNRREVVYERLDVYESQKPSLVFERKGNEYSFNAYKDLEAVVVRNLRNKLFLCTAASWNFNVAKPVVEFIVRDLHTCFAYSYNLPQILEDFKRVGVYDEYKRFCLALLNAGDLSISNFEMDEEEIPEQMKMLMLEMLNRNVNGIPANKVNTYKFTTMHKIEVDGEEKEIPLDLRSESLGTISLFNFAPLLFDSLKNGKTLFVDEIDKSLHPILVQYIVSLFLNKEINKYDAQLICNTHDTNLLSLEIFRRDEIWFMERNPRDGASELYPLTDFSPRKDENIEKGYMLGRYGAIPFIKADTDLWE